MLTQVGFLVNSLTLVDYLFARSENLEQSEPPMKRTKSVSKRIEKYPEGNLQPNKFNE